MIFAKIERCDGEVWITNINEDDIVESVFQENLREIDAETVKKYNLQCGDSVEDVEKLTDDDGELADIIQDSDFAHAHVGDYINIDELDDNCLYTDSYTDTIYDASIVKNWDTEKYYKRHNGSNFEMIHLLDIKDIDVVEFENENYDTGRKTIYKIFGTGNFITIDYSFYQGSFDTIIEGDEFIEDYDI